MGIFVIMAVVYFSGLHPPIHLSILINKLDLNLELIENGVAEGKKR